MARHYIVTTVEYWYESSNDEFASDEEAKEFGWNIDEMQGSEVQKIRVQPLDNEDDSDVYTIEEEDEENE